ncbi:MAG: DMT family transporter [Candidatus Latescibacteria bacterium]|nr:DMT family transporter [Candidatus Latescibacterota bacterium]
MREGGSGRTDRRRRLAGFGLILLSALSFGAMPIFGRLAYRSGVDPVTLLLLRFSIATAIMLPVMFAQRLPWPRGRTLLGLIAMGAAGYVGQSICFFTALKHASAGLVSLLLYLYPALVAVLSVVVLKEQLTPRKMLALGLALAGAVLTIGLSGGGTPTGVALGVGAAVIYALYIIYGTHLLKSVPPIPAAAVILAATAVVYAGLVAARGPQWPATAAGWGWIAAIAAISTVVATVTFLAGLERIGPTSASTLSTVEPVISVSLAALVLGERLAPLGLIGGVMILGAVLLLARSELPRQGRPRRRDHEDPD